MTEEARLPRSYVLFIVAIMIATGVGHYFLSGNLVTNLWDDGFFWDGALRTLQGQVPLRDFAAYDPGRYYWGAAWMKLFGTGLTDLRISAIIFGSLGIGLASLMLLETTRSKVATLSIVLPIWLWMFWIARMFSYTDALAIIFAGYLFARRPSTRRAFLLGAVSGIVMIFGRNHSLYGFIANALLLLCVCFRIKGKVSGELWGSWITGGFCGLLPTVALILLTPGLLQANIDWVNFLRQVGGTNLTLPYPWPWSVADEIIPIFNSICFAIVPVTVMIALAVIIFGKEEKVRRAPLLLASFPVTGMFFHSSISRADAGHLADSIIPALVLLSALITYGSQAVSRKLYLETSAALLLISGYTLADEHPAIGYLKSWSNGVAWTTATYQGEQLRIAPYIAPFLSTFDQFMKTAVREDPVALFPSDALLYGLYGRVAPVYNTFSVFPVIPENRQRRIIEDLEAQKVKWVVIDKVAVDWRSELSFPNNHPLVMEYLGENYVRNPEWSGRLGREAFLGK